MFFWSFRGVIAFLVCFIFFASLFVWPDSRVAHAFHWAEPRVIPALFIALAIWAFMRAGDA